MVWPRFDKKNNVLVQHEYKCPIFEESYLVRYLRKRLFTYLLSVDNTLIQNFFFDFIKLHFVSIRDELKIINPNIKMINVGTIVLKCASVQSPIKTPLIVNNLLTIS